jgi:hypothetical protein
MPSHRENEWISCLVTHKETGNEDVRATYKEAIAMLIVMIFEGPSFPELARL